MRKVKHEVPVVRSYEQKMWEIAVKSYTETVEIMKSAKSNAVKELCIERMAAYEVRYPCLKEKVSCVK